MHQPPSLLIIFGTKVAISLMFSTSAWTTDYLLTSKRRLGGLVKLWMLVTGVSY